VQGASKFAGEKCNLKAGTGSQEKAFPASKLEAKRIGEWYRICRIYYFSISDPIHRLN
jgi:hypothetical protein